jgi:putative ABC transporter-associated repeat protein
MISTLRRAGAPARLTLALAASLAVLASAPVAAHAAGDSDPALDQQVEGSEDTASDQAVVDTGHVDVGPRFVDGTWRLQARDDRAVPAVWRSADDTVIRVLDTAVLPVPDSPDYAFLSTESGTPVHVVPQTQASDVVWLGWNTQDPEVVAQVDRGATLTLHGVQGPGDVYVFLQEGVAGAPNVLWDSDQAFPQDLWMDVNTHVHANWVFTEPGVYLLDVDVHADLTSGEQVVDRTVLRFAVGDATDTREAVSGVLAADTASEPEESPADAADVEAPSGAAPAPGDTAGLSAPVVGALVGVGAALVLVAAGGGVLAARRRRAQVDAEYADRPAPERVDPTRGER